MGFLFFPVLRRGSDSTFIKTFPTGFYSSPSCDGDHDADILGHICYVSILPRLATGIQVGCKAHDQYRVSILPRLATGIRLRETLITGIQFLFFPVLRRGSARRAREQRRQVSILPRLATGITARPIMDIRLPGFYSSPSCDGDRISQMYQKLHLCFYSSPSCDGDR